MSGPDARLVPDEVVPPGFGTLPADAPRVAVVVSLTFPGMSGESHTIMKAFTRSAFEQLLECGARAVLVDSSAPDPSGFQVVAATQAVLFLGGGDVDAEVYGHSGPVPNEYGTDRRADDYCLELLRHSVAADQPVLALCRGSQLLNVALGGTLIPDLQPATLHKGAPGAPLFVNEAITLAPESTIASIYGRERIVVRSGHHQAVGRVAPDLVVTARADDGVVEATEHPGRRWVLGLQWHPEDREGSAEDRQRLFGELVRQAALRLPVPGDEPAVDSAPVQRSAGVR